MKNRIRVGGAGGFWGDSPVAMEQLVIGGELDYVVHDYLAELTLAIMAKQRDRDPRAGYATDFVTFQLKPILHEIARRGIKVVTNAGGINPRACAEALAALAAGEGVDLSIGIVEGDDLMPAEDALRCAGTVEMFSGEPMPAKLTSVNAYIGAFPIAEALARGADIVVTGRCADSAMVLGPLIHEFGWSPDDYDRLAGGSLAGHIVECGTQTTGGLFTDWERVEGRSDLGYPIAECYPDGTFLLTKPPRTGGLIEPLVAAEQMLYEVGDPRNYLLPDVTVDLSQVEIVQHGPEAVRFSGIRGRAPTATYKASAIHTDGYRASATLTLIGRNATGKARAVGNSILERVGALLRRGNLGDFTETNIEVLGAETAYFGDAAASVTPREAVLRVSVRHPDAEAVRLFAREIAPFGTGGTPGTTGFAGRPKPQEVYRLFSFLVDKNSLAISVEVDGDRRAFTSPPSAAAFEASRAPMPALQVEDGERIEVPLRTIAVARSGDKADISHLALIARDRAFYPALLEQITEEKLRNWFGHLAHGRIERFDVPGIAALNIQLHEALGGGGTASLRSDALGKAFGEIALDMTVSVPRAWLGRASFAADAMAA